MPAFLCIGLLFSWLSWLAGASLAQSSSSAGPPGGEPTQAQGSVHELREFIDELTQNNPAIHAARYRYAAASQRPVQASTLPDPKLSFVDFGVGHPFSGFKSNFAYLGLGVSQEIPFPGKLSLAGQEASKEAASGQETYRTVVLETTARLKFAYYEWSYVWKTGEILDKNRTLLERFEQIARARYAVGQGIQQDVLKAQVELLGLAQQREQLGQRRGSIEAQINALLNRAPGMPLGRPAELKQSPFSVEFDSLLSLTEANSPRLQAAQFLVDSRAVGVDRAKKDYRPDFNIGFQWQHTGSFPDYYMATAEVELPIYFQRKQRHEVEEAVARLQESRQDHQATRQELLFTAKDHYLVARTSERVLALFETRIIPQAVLALESASASYEVGKVDFLTLTDNLMTLLNFELQYYEELAKHEQALAQLEGLIATPLTQP